MIRNNYEIINDVAIIHVIRKNGDKYKVLIDKEDLQLIDKMNLVISVQWHRGTNDYYARMTKYINKANGGPKYEILMLHRLIMNALENEEVDHVEHNTLDNRKQNLRKSIKQNN